MQLLLSKAAMKKAQMKIDLVSDTVTVFGNEEKLITTSGSHYCMKLIIIIGEDKNDLLAVDFLNLECVILISNCEKCGKGFQNQDYMRNHVNKVHNGEAVSNCEKCGKGFKNPDYLMNHVNKVHNVEAVMCQVCSKVCKSKANLYKH